MSRVLLLTIVLLSTVNEMINAKGFNLEQVLILGRHHVRSPLAKLEVYSSRKLPSWNYSIDASLTSGGFELEGYLGEFFAAWLSKERFFDGCPIKGEVLIRPNIVQRTVATAVSFMQAVFPRCYYVDLFIFPDPIHGFDPIFFPIYHNHTTEFKDQIRQEMLDVLDETDMTGMYYKLNSILDIKNSVACENHGLCDLNNEQNKVFLKDNEEPNVFGPLHVSLKAADTFLMSYYEGLPLEDIAWGQLTNDSEWKILSTAFKVDQKSRFSVPSGSKDIAAPLLQYMFERLDKGQKFTYLVGHESNLNSVIHALGFRFEELSDEYEPYPIGGKIVFQKWTDENDHSFLKVDYVYQTKDQMRHRQKLSLNSPPKIVPMVLPGCVSKIHPELCPWEYFMTILSEFK